MSEATFSPEAFEAAFMPEAVNIVPGLQINIHERIMEKMTQEQRNAVDSCRRYGMNSNDLEVKIQAYAHTAETLHAQIDAVRYLQYMERLEADLKEAMKKAAALKAYYQHAAAILAATDKRPIIVLSRNCDRWSRDKKVTYSIHEGHYDLTVGKAIQGAQLATFEGKQHREARAKFAELVKMTEGCRGYEVHNCWFSHIEYDKPAISA